MKSVSIQAVRECTGVVVPAYFSPEVPSELIRRILEELLVDQSIFCEPRNTVIVVDRDTAVASLLQQANPGSSLYGWNLHILERNRGKAGAIEAGLAELLEISNAEYLVTRDCDCDHSLEDLPRLVRMAVDIREATGEEEIGVMGARPSLEKPMGWVREEWELLTNQVLVDLIAFAMASRGAVIDRRFWAGGEPDIQSGYRVYSREAARHTVKVLHQVPDEPAIFTFACEFLPFAEVLLAGGTFGQVQRMTLVEQPVSSYRSVDFSKVYGSLLRYVADQFRVSPEILLRILDGRLPSASLYFTEHRREILRCRQAILPGAPEPCQSRFL